MVGVLFREKEMKDLVNRVAICPRENKKRVFKPTDRFARQFGVTYECQSCGQVVNEMWAVK